LPLLGAAACTRELPFRASTPVYTEAADRGSPGAIEPRSVPVQSYADAVDRASPAVVIIRAARRLRAPQQFPFFEDPFFRRFFGERFPSGSPNASPVERALGSGVIVSADGHILTNHHVVDGADEIAVELANRRTYAAKLIGSDAPSDLALLQIGASSLPILPL